LNSTLIQIYYNQENNAKSMNAHDIYIFLYLFLYLKKIAYQNSCNPLTYHAIQITFVLCKIRVLQAGSQLTRVLIDGGSGLNLLFMITLKKMGLDISNMLSPSKAPFYGIVLGNAATPLGSVVLLVTFGTKDNYRTEYIKFEVANFESSYHAILGRPALVKFMAMPHYVYLLLKMLGMPGVLMLRGDLKKSYDCDQEAIKYALTSCVPEPPAEVVAAAQKLTDSEMEISNKRPSQSRVKPNPNVIGIKAIQLQEGDPSKIALIGGGLNDK
jgi:hypothetical protein